MTGMIFAQDGPNAYIGYHKGDDGLHEAGRIDKHKVGNKTWWIAQGIGAIDTPSWHLRLRNAKKEITSWVYRKATSD